MWQAFFRLDGRDDLLRPNRRILFFPVFLAKAFADDLPMHEGILAHVECDEMEAVGIDTPHQPLDGEQPAVLAAISSQAVGNNLYVLTQFVHILVGVDIVVVSRLQTLLNQPQQHAVRHIAVPHRYRVIGVLEDVAIFFDLVQDRLADRDARRRLAEFRGQLATLIVVKIQRERALPGECLAYGFGIDVRVTVHVAADPRRKTQYVG